MKCWIIMLYSKSNVKEINSCINKNTKIHKSCVLKKNLLENLFFSVLMNAAHDKRSMAREKIIWSSWFFAYSSPISKMLVIRSIKNLLFSLKLAKCTGSWGRHRDLWHSEMKNATYLEEKHLKFRYCVQKLLF